MKFQADFESNLPLSPTLSPPAEKGSKTSTLAAGKSLPWVVVIGFLLLTVGNIHAQEVTPEAGIETRRLLFVSERDGNREIYVVNDDGTGLQNLTNNAADDAYPVWSPDGSQIAFQSNRDGNWEIYVIDADGGNTQNLTNNPADDERPNWSPLAEGSGCILRSIFFQSNPSNKWDIYSIGGEEGIREWTYLIEDDVWNAILAPDGCTIAYRIHLGNTWLLNFADTYTLQANLVTTADEDDGVFSWSPDSRHIVFERSGEIYSATVDGSLPPINLTLSDAYDSSPAWSPAGNQIAYVSNWDIYTMNAADGSDAYNLTQNPAYDVSPTWSPDAQQIAFASFRDANWEIYAMHSDGCNVRRLTNDEGWDGLPQWQPQIGVDATIVERAPTAIVTTPNANLRDGAGENFAVIATAAQGECLSISGRDIDGSWLQIEHNGAMLWVSASIVEIVGDVRRIPTLER